MNKYVFFLILVSLFPNYSHKFTNVSFNPLCFPLLSALYNHLRLLSSLLFTVSALSLSPRSHGASLPLRNPPAPPPPSRSAVDRFSAPDHGFAGRRRTDGSAGGGATGREVQAAAAQLSSQREKAAGRAGPGNRRPPELEEDEEYV